MRTPEDSARIARLKLPAHVADFIATALDALGQEPLPLFAWAAGKGARRSSVVFTIFDGRPQFVAVHIPNLPQIPNSPAVLCDVYVNATLETVRFFPGNVGHFVADKLRELAGPGNHY